MAEYPGCKVVESYEELFGMEGIDLVVNVSYSKMHYPITKDLLQHGFHVLVEKPFAANHYEGADLIKTAKEKGVVLAVFQQTFLDYSDEMKVVYSKLACAMTSGDSDDFCKAILTAPGKPVIDLEINNTDAFSDYNIKIQGTRGTYKCAPSAYKMKYIVDGENPERPVIRESLKDAEGYPIYCGEKLITHEEEGTFEGTAFDVGTESVYRVLNKKLTEGAELTMIVPENAAKIINVIETIRAQNPLPVKF